MYCRIRPNKLLSDSSSTIITVLSSSSLSTLVVNNEEYNFERIFNENSQQIDIFETVGRPLVNDLINGKTSSIFVCGSSGSGKTYTVLGQPHNSDDVTVGVLPRCFNEIFTNILKFQTESSTEISERTQISVFLNVIVIGSDKIEVQKLENHQITTTEDALNIFTDIQTNIKEHLVATIQLRVTPPEEPENIIVSELTIVVLSEISSLSVLSSLVDVLKDYNTNIFSGTVKLLLCVNPTLEDCDKTTEILQLLKSIQYQGLNGVIPSRVREENDSTRLVIVKRVSSENILEVLEHRIKKRELNGDEYELLKMENEKLIRIIDEERNKCYILQQTNEILTEDLTHYTTENNELINLFNTEKTRNTKLDEEIKEKEKYFNETLEKEKHKNCSLERIVRKTEHDLKEFKRKLADLLEDNETLRNELHNTIEDSKWSLLDKESIIEDLNRQLNQVKKTLQIKFGKTFDDLNNNNNSNKNGDKSNNNGNNNNKKMKTKRRVCSRCARVANLLENSFDLFDDECLSPLGPSGITRIFIKQKKKQQNSTQQEKRRASSKPKMNIPNISKIK